MKEIEELRAAAQAVVEQCDEVLLAHSMDVPAQIRQLHPLGITFVRCMTQIVRKWM